MRSQDAHTFRRSRNSSNRLKSSGCTQSAGGKTIRLETLLLTGVRRLQGGQRHLLSRLPENALLVSGGESLTSGALGQRGVACAIPGLRPPNGRQDYFPASSRAAPISPLQLSISRWAWSPPVARFPLRCASKNRLTPTGGIRHSRPRRRYAPSSAPELHHVRTVDRALPISFAACSTVKSLSESPSSLPAGRASCSLSHETGSRPSAR